MGKVGEAEVNENIDETARISRDRNKLIIYCHQNGTEVTTQHKNIDKSKMSSGKVVTILDVMQFKLRSHRMRQRHVFCIWMSKNIRT